MQCARDMHEVYAKQADLFLKLLPGSESMRLDWPPIWSRCEADVICPLLREQSVVDIRTSGIIERKKPSTTITETEISYLRAVAGYRTRDRKRRIDIRIGNNNNWCQLVMAPSYNRYAIIHDGSSYDSHRIPFNWPGRMYLNVTHIT